MVAIKTHVADFPHLSCCVSIFPFLKGQEHNISGGCRCSVQSSRSSAVRWVWTVTASFLSWILCTWLELNVLLISQSFRNNRECCVAFLSKLTILSGNKVWFFLCVCVCVNNAPLYPCRPSKMRDFPILKANFSLILHQEYLLCTGEILIWILIGFG